ncbi:Pectic acid lyase [Stieleria neptunia]|uniref:Pectic acid lyase n=1 Tax=Stieleria neptunia TaxID=2527979 RepID=A0A518HL44_9BACT|nr:pectate lyase [Stieleria neptunia]QDV41572.1 Pectic acid lyase [Stieleria neptunia]
MRTQLICLLVLVLAVPASAQSDLKSQAVTAMREAAGYYVENVATHGGYVYHYSLDLKQRWGEGVATTDQIWIQPPGTPTVGMALLEAYDATGDPFYLDAATAAAGAVVYGQLSSGGWTNCVDLNPKGERQADYRNGKGRGKNHSSLDDGQTQSALRFLVLADLASGFRNAEIHDSAITGLDALLAAQFPNGGFPQVWTGPVSDQPIKPANYPDYDWRTEGRIKNYWDMYTLNDNVTGYVADLLIDAHRVYRDDRYLDALKKLGDFLVLAQMPMPQPGWAQQYNYDMQPIWARKFEPPGVSGDETQEVLQTLMRISHVTGDDKYLEPIPAAASWLRQSRLPDGRLARYYELRTNRPLYMQRRGDVYELTYDDSNLPSHYGWKTESQLAGLREQYKRVRGGLSPEPEVSQRDLAKQAQQIIGALDGQRRWVVTFDGQRLVGQAKMPIGTPYLSSAVFSQNLSALASYVKSQTR